LESRLSESDDIEFEVEFEFPRGAEDVINVEALDSFNIKEVYYDCIDNGLKGKEAVEKSLENHFNVIRDAATDYFHGLEIMAILQDHIEHRLKHYTKCITKSTPNYYKYIIETYNRQLQQKLRAVLDDE